MPVTSARTAIIAAALALATSALAADAERPRMAVHPCSFTEADPAEEAVLRPQCAKATAAFPWADPVPPTVVEAWLQKRPGHDCQRDRACLVSLATDLHASLALFVSVAPRTSEGVRVSAMIVDTQSRVLTDQVWTFARPQKSTPDIIAALVVSAIHQIREPTAQPQPRTLTAQPSSSAPPLPAAQPKVTVSWALPAVLAAGGAVAGIGGLISRQLALGDVNAFQAALANGPASPADRDALLALRASGERRFTIANISFGVAAACLVSAGVLFGYKLVTEDVGSGVALSPVLDPARGTAGVAFSATLP